MIAAYLAATAAFSQANPVSITERVSFSVEGTGSVIHVETSVESMEAVSALKPRCYFGTPNIPQYVKDLKSLEGSQMLPDDVDANKVKLVPNDKGVIKFRYTMAYPSTIGDSYTFAPINSSRHFRSQLCQWMYAIGDPEKKYDYRFEVTSVPEGWTSYSSLGPTDKVITANKSFAELVSSVIGAGDVHRKTVQIEGKPVLIILDKGFKIESDEILDQTAAMVKLQRNWFNDHSFPYYVVSIAERPDNVAGAGLTDIFVCFLRPEASRLDLLKLLSHEMAHNWIPQKIYVPTENTQADRWRWEWFDEGVTDYISWLILRESGSFTQDEFVAAINQALVNISDDPHRTVTAEGAAKAIEGGQFSVAYKKLSYYRGSIMAANWDAEIRQRSGGDRNLGHAIRELYATAAKSDAVISEAIFDAHFAKEGIDTKMWREKHIMRGEPIPVDEGIGGEGYEVVKKWLPRYDAGFDFDKSRAERKIGGVVEGGPADKAGLRDGMEYVGSRNSNRFGNAYRADLPLTIIVKVDGVEKEIAYRAEGEPVEVLQIEKK